MTSPGYTGVRDVALVHAVDPSLYRASHPGDIEFVEPQRPVIAWRECLHNKTDFGDILFSTSDNAGATWSEPRAMLSHLDTVGGERVGYGNVILHAQREAGALYAFAGRAPLEHPDSEEQRQIAMRSLDGGRTWDEFETSFPDVTAITGGKILKHGGEFLMPFHRNETRHDLPPCRFRARRAQDKRDHSAFVSRDLKTWQMGGIIPTDPPGSVFLQEGYLVPAQNDPDEVVCFMRTAIGGDVKRAFDPPRAFSSCTCDNGRSWSVARIEPEVYNSSSKSIVTRAADGRYVCVFNEGPAWERKVLSYITKAPGQNWSEPRRFFEDGGYNAYVSLVEHAPGRFYAMWWASTKGKRDDAHRAVRFGRFDLL